MMCCGAAALWCVGFGAAVLCRGAAALWCVVFGATMLWCFGFGLDLCSVGFGFGASAIGWLLVSCCFDWWVVGWLSIVLVQFFLLTFGVRDR
ncbi:hypothetical protein U1Q18_009327, partial [Sarracenia purpurea var. burkii]